MNELPSPETYERELEFMPYRKSLQRVLEIVSSQAPEGGKVLDLMCGPGYLLSMLQKARADVQLVGLDNDGRYLAYSRNKYPKMIFMGGSVIDDFDFVRERYDVVMCTGALHHIPYEKQESVIKKMANLVRPDGLVILSDCHIDDYSTETERKLAAAKLGSEYLIETIANGAPDDVIKATADIIANDVLMDEFKTSVKKRNDIVKKHFSSVKIEKIWPTAPPESYTYGYGDYIFTLRGKK